MLPTTFLCADSRTASALLSASAEGKRHRHAPFAAPLQSPNTEVRAGASTSEVLAQYLSPSLHAPVSGSQRVDYALAPRSRFTGSGLGIRRAEALEFRPQGSARMIIDQVLKQQLQDMGS